MKHAESQDLQCENTENIPRRVLRSCAENHHAPSKRGKKKKSIKKSTEQGNSEIKAATELSLNYKARE